MNVKYRLSAFWLVLAALLFCAPAAFAEEVANAAPYTIDYVNETLKFDSAKYKLTDAETTPLEYDEAKTLTDGVSLGDYIVTAGTDAKSLILNAKSDGADNITVTIPPRPVVPLVADWKNGTTLGIYKSNFYYWFTVEVSDPGEPFSEPPHIQCREDHIPLVAIAEHNNILHVQSVAVNADNETGATPTFASAIATLTIPAKRAAPSADDIVIKGTTPDTITVSKLTGGEYCAVPTAAGSTANKFDWKALSDFTTTDSDSNPVLTGLTPDTEYTVKVRYAADDGNLPSEPLALTASTQKAGSLKIVPVDADGKPFAGLDYNVWVPAPAELDKDHPKTVFDYTLTDLEAKHGLKYIPADGTESVTDPKTNIELKMDAAGAITCVPSEWKVTVKPTIEATDYRATVKFTAAGATLPDAMWTFKRVGNVLYSDLVLPTGYHLPENQAPSDVALQLSYVKDTWKALPENGLTVAVEANATPAPTSTATVAPTVAPTAAPAGNNKNDDPPTPIPAPTEEPDTAPTVAPTAVPAPAPAPAPVSDPTAGRLMPGTTTTSANRNQQATNGTTFTAKPEGDKADATPTASPTPSPKPTPSATPVRPTATATAPEDATPEDGDSADSPTGKTPAWLYVLLLAMAGGGLYALWLVMFHLPKKRAAELDLFKSSKSKSDDKNEK